MNLGKVYKRLFEGRKTDYFELLKEAPMVQAFPKMKTDAERKAALEPSAGVPGQEPEPLDIEYYSDQLNKLMDGIRDFHQELGTEVEMREQETGNYEYGTMEKQLSRYVLGAEKQLERLQKYLERQKGKGL